MLIQMGSIFAVICLFPQSLNLLYKFKSPCLLAIGHGNAQFLLDFWDEILLRAFYFPIGYFLGLIVGGVALIIADRKANLLMKIMIRIQLHKQSLLICCWQCLLWPGMSRSAMTMIGGTSGLNRTTSASFSFLL